MPSSFFTCVSFFSSRRRHTRYWRDWSSDVCSSDLAKILKENNFIQDYKTLDTDEGRTTLRVVLKYAQGGQPVIRELRRVSTPGLRKYVGCSEIPRVRNGLGMAILSTSQGVMSDRQARQKRTGGELIALVW